MGGGVREDGGPCQRSYACAGHEGASSSGYAAGDTILVFSPVSLSSYSTFLCIAAGWVDKNAHTIGTRKVQF